VSHARRVAELVARVAARVVLTARVALETCVVRVARVAVASRRKNRAPQNFASA
jgi:hypothetical protein